MGSVSRIQTSAATSRSRRRATYVFGLNLFSVVVFAAIADDDPVALAQPGENLYAGAVLHAEPHLTFFHDVVRTDRQHRRVVAVSADCLQRDGQGILFFP